MTAADFDDLAASALRDHDRITAVYGEPHEDVVEKVAAVVDEATAAYVAATTLAFLATHSPDGRCDVTPRGGPPGFIRVLGDRLLAFPDLPGNRRLDTMHNIADTGRLGALLIIPGREDAVRCNGRAVVTAEPDVLGAFPLERKPPVLAIVLEVDEVYIHCPKALKRSNAWKPERWPDASTVPTMSDLWHGHLAANRSASNRAGRSG